MKRKGILFVFSAPSGAGKTTICKEVLKSDKNLKFSVSYTSRPKRQDEINGESYWFVTREKFEKMIITKKFVEWAEVHGNYYGSPREYINKTIKNGIDILLDIDVQGGMNIRRLYRDNSVLIFILPPSFKKLEQRLKKRKTDSCDVIARRLENAKKEIISLPHYDYFVINDNLDEAISNVMNIITVERMKIKYYDFSKLKSVEKLKFTDLKDYFRYF
ncbi:MAG: guanylate kinase [Candidatus Hydrogenedentota bacterium]